MHGTGHPPELGTGHPPAPPSLTTHCFMSPNCLRPQGKLGLPYFWPAALTVPHLPRREGSPSSLLFIPPRLSTDAPTSRGPSLALPPPVLCALLRI